MVKKEKHSKVDEEKKDPLLQELEKLPKDVKEKLKKK